jgi:ketosteroid isomerase-like protein
VTRAGFAAAAGLGIALLAPGSGEGCDFDCTLKRHLDAIQAKDYAAFESTLTRGDRLTFILPDGVFSEDPTHYREALEEWFVKGGWTFEYETVAVERSAEMGSALLRVSYDEEDRGGQPYHLDHYLLLIFEKQGEEWFLVHDQNTEIRPDQPR